MNNWNVYAVARVGIGSVTAVPWGLETVSLSIGIVGLPNVGKSTLFNAITNAGAEAANYPFTTIEPNVGVVDLPDPRLRLLNEILNPPKVIPAAVKFVDIAGLVEGASRGEGLGNKFLAHIRETDAIAHVVRCFEDENTTHVDGSVDPVRDIETINVELIFADLETVDRRLDRAQRLSKSGSAEAKAEAALLARVKSALEDGRPARLLDYDDQERAIVAGLHLITMKPVMYVANVGEGELAELIAAKDGAVSGGASDNGARDNGAAGGNRHVEAVRRVAAAEQAQALVVSAAIEAELIELPQEERAAFLAELGLKEPGLDRVIRAGFELLGLMTYFTFGEKELRAWTIRNGMKAPQAAGVIHTDFERGFIRAEVISYEDMVETKSREVARERGLARLEGKDYVVRDGDFCLFRFNV